MNVSIGAHWEAFVDKLVKSGRYGSASEVIRQGLRHVEEHEAKLKSLREDIQSAIDEDIWFSFDEVEAHIRENMAAENKAAE
ncbi:MAG: type II toxin-antitoxin system ParD family antitoxin [Devosia nanyangense]|uniref:Type II toxin-antitoxin system ParD family antitoxin n=1 Tax=Devosia nanyangense TaxID=1228055 RepID=A0A933L2I3_9HYPH|nr:type II toxin-antitoxin system ParD family antitoxin [Devosia nanyangense]